MVAFDLAFNLGYVIGIVIVVLVTLAAIALFTASVGNLVCWLLTNRWLHQWWGDRKLARYRYPLEEQQYTPYDR